MGESLLATSRAAFDTGFHRRGGELYCDGVPLSRLADATGTPAYVYSAAEVRRRYRDLADAFAPFPHRIHYSAKANSNLSLLSLFHGLGAGVDIVSGGELLRATRAGFGGDDIVFSGVGKTAAELEAAARAGLKLVNIESREELRAASIAAERQWRVMPVALRVNPEVLVDTPHPYTRTGEKGHKFGIPFDEALEAGIEALALPGLELRGLAMHIGSQVSDTGPYKLALDRLLVIWSELESAGASSLRYLDMGGGLAVSYSDEHATDPRKLAAVVEERWSELHGAELILEPGRFLVATAGVLLTRVLYRKRGGGKDYIVIDAGMNDLVRPSHYGAYHSIQPVVSSGRTAVVDVVGPLCESGDFLALGRRMEDAEPGDILAVMTAGAYGFVMASNYNSRPRPAEVLVDGKRFAVVRQRETYENLLNGEPAEPLWRTA